jgi:hypothetical protein
MDADQPKPDLSDEAKARRIRQLADERAALAEATAQATAGYYVNGDDVDAWLASLDTVQPLPRPQIRRC